ncbi:CHAT domain-containing protein [Spirulina major CS-329]|uniref:CHAT domain-containing tetratricopeptide repeat protein n=1 Tax=Spirulina TaxID=1154 RepID=UPI00232DA6FE|nr:MULTISPECIES: CHAT domain-containing protein [Spirulina]MDB9493183.1 CHAT domain-containing protein [Spirulina subsalsa CS-330]MDB9501979.1 CHAT domain-containing protein [Spirulina major CS-329]
MTRVVVLNFGLGSLETGFPSITARLGLSGPLLTQSTASLPPAPHIVQLYRSWRVLYDALASYPVRQLSTPGISIEATGITHISTTDFENLNTKLSQALNTWLNHTAFRPIERHLRTHISPTETFRIVIESDQELLWRLPWQAWELLKTDYPYGEIALSPPNYSAPVLFSPPLRRQKVRVLVILGDSRGINVMHDVRVLKQLPGIQLTTLDEPSRAEVIQALWAKRWDILLFSGHSSSHHDATHGTLFINPTAHHNKITITELQEALNHAVQQGLQLAIFNSCDGLGLARDLAAAQIPLPPFVVMREAVPDCVAHTFLKSFLRTFAEGYPFHLAVRYAREQLRSLEDKLPGVSGLPIICQHPAVIPPTWAELRGQELKTTQTRPLPGQRRYGWGLALASVLVVYGFWGEMLAQQLNQWGNAAAQEDHLVTSRWFYQGAIALAPLASEAYYNLGRLCEQKQENLDCAFKAYRNAANRGSGAAIVKSAQLSLRTQTHRVEEVIVMTERCLHSSQIQVQAECFSTRAWALWEDGRPQEAKFWTQKSLRLSLTNPHALCLYAQILESEKNPSQARVYWEQVIKYSHYHTNEQNTCLKKAYQRRSS